MVDKITALIPENDEYLNEFKTCMLSDAALLTVKVAGAKAAQGERRKEKVNREQ